MPRIVDYDEVLTTAEAAGFRCGYPYGSAFVLRDEMTPPRVACWSAGEDATVRPIWKPTMRPVPQDRLAPLAVQAWQQFGGGDVWLAPVHSWASELQHGDGDWLEPLLLDIGIDPIPLRPRTKADALAFSPDEADVFERTLSTVLDKLWKSDFALLLPAAPRGLFCTVHHHKQLWWQCVDQADAARLRDLPVS